MDSKKEALQRNERSGSPKTRALHVDLKHLIIYGVSLAILVATALISIGVGSIPIPIPEIIQSLTNPGALSETHLTIIYHLRLPRIVLALFVGSALSVSGALMQAVMQNPLADPGIIGVSSGASLFIMLVLLVFPIYASMLPLIAFCGGILATLVIYILSWKNGISSIRLLLAGIAVNAMLGGGSSLLSVLNSEKIQSVIMWLNGTLAGRNWNDIMIYVPYLAVASWLSLFCIRPANLLALGDEKAANLGANVSRARVLLSLLGAFLASAATAAVGVIGFIGLVVPHIARMVVGSDYKHVFLFSLINGATFLLLTDTLARTIVAPIELPVGTIMAVIGGPFFLYLLRKGRTRA